MLNKNKKNPIVELPVQKTESKGQAIEVIKERLDLHQNVIYFCLVVAVLGFFTVVVTSIGIFIQYKNFTSEKYSEFNATLEESKRMIIEEKDKNVQDILSNISSEIERLSDNKK